MSRKKKGRDIAIIVALISTCGVIIGSFITVMPYVVNLVVNSRREKIPSEVKPAEKKNSFSEPVSKESVTSEYNAQEKVKENESSAGVMPTGDGISGEIIFKNGARLNFSAMKSNFSMGSWSENIYYSRSIESLSYSNWIYFKDISRIDFLEITKAERERDPDYRWILKAKIIFKDSTVWNGVYLHARGWLYTSKNGNGALIKFGYMSSTEMEYPNDIKSIIFK